MASDANEADDESEGKKGGSCLGQMAGVAVCVLICAGLGGMILYYGSTDVLRYLLNLVPKNPGWEWRIGFCLAIIVSIVLILPIWPPMCMAAGLIFGFWEGLLINLVGILLAANISFVIGRLVLHDPIRDCVQNGDYPRIRRMMLVLEDEDSSLKFQVLFRFLFIPMFIRNYGPSTLQVPLWKLSVGAIPHSIWISVLFASLGATFQDLAQLLRDGKEFDWEHIRWQQALIAGAAVLVAVGLAFYAHAMYVKKLEEEEGQPIQGDVGGSIA